MVTPALPWAASLDLTFSEEMLPNFQSKTPLVEHEAVSSCPMNTQLFKAQFSLNYKGKSCRVNCTFSIIYFF